MEATTSITEAKRPPILISTYKFICPICGNLVQRGSNYVRRGDFAVCLKCGLPARRLRPLIKAQES